MSKPTTVEEYVAQVPSAAQEKLQQLRELVKAEAPEANEVFSYGILGYKLPHQGRAFAFVSGYKEHASIYPVPRADEVLLKELEPHIAGKGTLRFELDQPLPTELIKKTLKALHSQASTY